MRSRKALNASIAMALVLAAGIANGAGNGDAAKPENRFFVIGDNSEYYRAGMPRPVVPTEKEAEIYFLREKLRLVERKLASLEQRSGEQFEAPGAEEPEVAPAHRAASQRTLPPPIAYSAASASKRQADVTGKTARADRVIRKPVRVSRLPDLPPLMLAQSRPSEVIPDVSADDVSAVALPSLPPVSARRRGDAVAATAVSFPSKTASTDSMDDYIIETAREIIGAARERVIALIATVSPARQADVATGAIARYPAQEPAPLPVIENKKEWVVLYRLPSEDASRKIAEKLDIFRIPVGSRDFMGGEYLMEVGVFDNEERARSRLTFLGYIVGVTPELRLRTVPTSLTLGVRG